MLISKLTICMLRYTPSPPACVFLLLPMTINSLAWADTAIVVVTNQQSTLIQLSREEVGDLFLGKQKSVQNVQLTPVDSSDDELREAFYQSVTDMSALRVKAYWSRIVFSGQGRPPKEVSMEEITADLLKKPDLLVYLPKNKVTAHMKVVYSIP